MNRKIVVSVISSLIVLVVLAGAVAAQSSPPRPPSRAAPVQAGPAGKLSFRLAALAQSASLRAANSPDQALALSLAPEGPGSLMRDAQGRILIYIRTADLSVSGLQALSAAGAQIVDVSVPYQTVTAFLDAADSITVANLAAVQSLEEELQPETGAVAPDAISRRPGQLAAALNAPLACPGGAQTSEGDTQLNAAAARSTYGINGAGVTVGILSDSFDQDATAVTRAITDVASGDLPGPGNPCGFPTATVVISTALSSGTADEGRAMLQIVHDLAPGANLKFASAFNGIFQFGSSIRNLRSAGADVLGDDVFYFADPFFQDSPIGVAISDVTASGALYFSLAGNHNRSVGGNDVSSYEAPAYRPTACPAGLPVAAGPDCHDFDPSAGVSSSSGVTLSNGGKLSLDFQWNEPWYGVTDNLDVYLLNDANTVVAKSINNNLTTERPWEYFLYQNVSGVTQHYRIVINRAAGTGTPRLKYLFLQYTNGLQSVQYNLSSGGDIVGPTLYGHSANHYGSSVAAVPYNNSSAPETYTSRGPATHYFGPVLNTSPAAPLSGPDTIQQPDFAATDGGCNTFFPKTAGGPCYRFYGTSAATPHAAAIAALLKQKANQLNVPLSVDWARFLMKSTAAPIGSYGTTSVGAGLLDALAATGKLLTSKFLFLPLIRR